MLFVVGDFYWDKRLRVADLPARGQSRKVAYLGENPGGCSPNTAARAAALGVPTVLVARLGVEDRERAASTCEHLPALELHPVLVPGRSPECLVLLTPDGERTLLFQGSPGTPYGPDALERLRRHASVVWVNEPAPAHRAALHEALSGNRHAALGGVHVTHFWEELDAGRHWQLIVGSLDEAPLPSEPELRRMDAKLCVMTDGARGGHVWVAPDAPPNLAGEARELARSAAPGWRRYEPEPVKRVIDTVGAGDAFLGGLLAGIALSLPLPQALHLAAWSGARAVESAGPWPAAELAHPLLRAA